MKIFQIIYKHLFLLCLIAGFTFSPVFGDTIEIAADEWCPYNCEVDSAMPGYAIEIARLIFEKKGHQFKYVIMPWTRALLGAGGGKYSGVVGAYKEDAPGFVFPDESFGISKNSFFVRKGASWRFKGIKSLDKVSIGIIRDYSYGAELDEYFKGIDDTIRLQVVSGTTALDMNIKKMIFGRFDVMIADPNVLKLAVKKMGVAAKIECAGDFGEGENLYMAFCPSNSKSKDYARILSVGIQQMRKDGSLLKILKKYGLSDWK